VMEVDYKVVRCASDTPPKWRINEILPSAVGDLAKFAR
jgi:hypothetical protein